MILAKRCVSLMALRLGLAGRRNTHNSAKRAIPGVADDRSVPGSSIFTGNFGALWLLFP